MIKDTENNQTKRYKSEDLEGSQAQELLVPMELGCDPSLACRCVPQPISSLHPMIWGFCRSFIT